MQGRYIDVQESFFRSTKQSLCNLSLPAPCSRHACEGASPKQSRLTCKQLFECKHWIASSPVERLLARVPAHGAGNDMDRKEFILKTKRATR
jgi:hypothetical protein